MSLNETQRHSSLAQGTRGLAGAGLYLASPLLDMFGHGFGVLMAPLAVAEIVLAVWLIVKGLDSPALREMPA